MAVSRTQISILSIYFTIGFMANNVCGETGTAFCTAQSEVFGLFQEIECYEIATASFICFDPGKPGVFVRAHQMCLRELEDDPLHHFQKVNCNKTGEVKTFVCYHHKHLPPTSHQYTTSKTEMESLSPTHPKEHDDDVELKAAGSYNRCNILFNLILVGVCNMLSGHHEFKSLVLLAVLAATSPVPTLQTTAATSPVPTLQTSAGPFCSRPDFTNPYAIVIEPDQPSYGEYFYLVLSCEEGHTPRGLSGYAYCQPDGSWDPNPTGGLCYAQCNTTELVADDDIIAMDNDTLRTIFDDGEIAYFYCADQGQSSGSNQGTCKNGTLDFIDGDNPSCLAYCPVYIAEHGDGLYYEIADDPVINEDNQTLYYRDGNSLTYRCSDGYDGPIKCNSSDCKSTCDDGTWDPPDIPVCEDIDECLSNPCQNNATCHDWINKYECECPDGFNGTLCQINIDDCGNHTCQNGATCIDGVASFKCQCPEGFNGNYCENEIDECSSNPCQNNATCNDLFDEYECICLDGFNGTNCENNIDDCANHTCQNGATCMDKVGAYECQCSDGYDGTYCENVITTPTMTTVIMTTDNTTSLGSTSEPVLTTTDQDMTTSELTTAMPLSTTMMTDQTTMAVTSSKAVTTDKMTTLLGTTLPSTTLTTSTDSSTSVMMTKTVGTTDTPAAATTITSDATTVTPDMTTVTSGMTTISKGTTAPTVPASTTESDSKATSVMTTEVVVTTDTPAAATTAITAATTVTPDATTITADGTTVSPGMTTILEETTVTSTKSPTEPRSTEKPPTTPLPCGGECLPTQVCNATDQCECRPDYYEDEDDNEEPCKVPTSIDVTMTITAVNGTEAVYKEEYANPESDEFKALEEDVCQPFNEIYRNESDYEGCRVIEFTNGSIIVNYVLTFVQNSTISVSDVNHTVYDELLNPNGSYTGELEFDDSSFSIAPLDECEKGIDNCIKNTNCTDQGEKGYTCECFTEVHVLPGQECPEPTEPPPITTEEPEEPGTATEPPRRTTEEPEEPGMEVWKVVVGVTVPIVGILTITIVGLVCWQYRRLDRTSPVSESTKLRTKPYQEDIGGSDRDASRPGSMMIMNNDGTVQEVVLPWRNDSSEGEFIFAPDIDSKGKNQMLPMVDYPSNYGPSSYDNDPLGNIVSSYDNYTYQNHDTRNTTEIDSRYF